MFLYNENTECCLCGVLFGFCLLHLGLCMMFAFFGCFRGEAFRKTARYYDSRCEKCL